MTGHQFTKADKPRELFRARHYEHIADTLLGMRPHLEEHVYSAIVLMFAARFKKDNSAFKRALFIDKCGVSEVA